MVMNALIRRVLDGIGLNPDRFSLQWASAAEAPRFVRLITEFTAQVRELGPLGSSEGLDGEELRQRLDKALEFVSDRKLRVAFGNLTKNLRKDGGKLSDEAIEEALAAKLAKQLASLQG